jgi:predicted DNA-binding transcriptional regulator AlpA
MPPPFGRLDPFCLEYPMNLLRFEDLRAKRIVRTWNTLNNWIDARGFPPGRMIGRFRTWTEAEVLAWIEAQPTTKIPPRGYAKRNGGAS